MTIDTAALFKAKQALNAFLEDHPELKDFQKEIDGNLNMSGNSQNRIAILTAMMRKNVSDLANKFNEIKVLAASASDVIKTLPPPK